MSDYCRVREMLSIHNIGQRLFAKYVLGLSQGTVSELLSKPKSWDKLTEKGRDSYRKMHAWVWDEGAILLLKTLIPRKGELLRSSNSNSMKQGKWKKMQHYSENIWLKHIYLHKRGTFYSKIEQSPTIVNLKHFFLFQNLRIGIILSTESTKFWVKQTSPLTIWFRVVHMRSCRPASFFPTWQILTIPQVQSCNGDPSETNWGVALKNLEGF